MTRNAVRSPGFLRCRIKVRMPLSNSPRRANARRMPPARSLSLGRVEAYTPVVQIRPAVRTGSTRRLPRQQPCERHLTPLRSASALLPQEYSPKPISVLYSRSSYTAHVLCLRLPSITLPQRLTGCLGIPCIVFLIS